MISRRFIVSVLGSGWLALGAMAQPGGTVVINEENPDSLPVLTQLDKAFAFIYGTWPGKVTVENGVAKLHGINSRGAAGANENMTAGPSDRAVLRIVVGDRNEAKRLRLVLRDGSLNTGVWEYDLASVPRNIPTLIRPVGNAPLSQPHWIDKRDGSQGAIPDMTKLTQWKISGDWSLDALDVEVSVILLAD